MMIIAPNSRVRKEGQEEVKGVYQRIWGEEEENADYGGMVQPIQQHVAPCVKGVEVGLDTRCLKIVAVFSAGIPVLVKQEACIVPRCTRAAIGTIF